MRNFFTDYWLFGILYYLDFKLDEIKTLQYLPLIHSNNSYLVKIESNRYYIQTLQREIILGICCKIDTRCKNTHHVFIVLLQVRCKILIQSTQNKIQMCKGFTIFWSSFCYNMLIHLHWVVYMSSKKYERRLCGYVVTPQNAIKVEVI